MDARERRYVGYMALMVTLLLPLLLLPLGGCSTVEVSRTDTSLDVTYRSFLTKIQAPRLEVDKKGDYTATFNAESVNRAPDFGPIRDIVEMGVTGKAPRDQSEDDQ